MIFTNLKLQKRAKTQTMQTSTYRATREQVKKTVTIEIVKNLATKSYFIIVRVTYIFIVQRSKPVEEHDIYIYYWPIT